MLSITSNTAKLFINNLLAEGLDDVGSGFLINGNSNTPDVGIINIVSNRVIDPNLTTQYTIGLISEPNLNVPKF